MFGLLILLWVLLVVTGIRALKSNPVPPIHVVEQDTCDDDDELPLEKTVLRRQCAYDGRYPH